MARRNEGKVDVDVKSMLQTYEWVEGARAQRRMAG